MDKLLKNFIKADLIEKALSLESRGLVPCEMAQSRHNTPIVMLIKPLTT